MGKMIEYSIKNGILSFLEQDFPIALVSNLLRNHYPIKVSHTDMHFHIKIKSQVVVRQSIIPVHNLHVFFAEISNQVVDYYFILKFRFGFYRKHIAIRRI